MTKPIIQIENLQKSFTVKSGSVEALKDISLTVNEGEIYGIIGLSGAGKSTLIRCINYLEVPTSGEVVFDGNKLSSMNSKQLIEARQSMGMIFQQFQLLAQRNVLQNICFPLELKGVGKRERVERARELLKLVDLADKEKSYPAQLSGGQKQRVAIARALATNPKVLLCDEATSALDPNTTKSILELIKKLNETLNITVVIITHEMDVISTICNKVSIIDKGVIAESGTVADVFRAPKSHIGQQLILGEAMEDVHFDNNKYYRISFDGRQASEPIISNITLAVNAPINIMYASTKAMGDKAVGQMVIQLPENTTQANAILSYLDKSNIAYEEVTRDAI